MRLNSGATGEIVREELRGCPSILLDLETVLQLPLRGEAGPSFMLPCSRGRKEVGVHALGETCVNEENIEAWQYGGLSADAEV